MATKKNIHHPANDGNNLAAEHLPDGNPVFVSEVIGQGDDVHRIVRVGEWSMVVRGTDAEGEPEVPDTALAPRLGLEIRRLRWLSDKHEKAGNIAPRICLAASQNRGRPGKQRFYTEADALFLVTRSEAAGAVALTREMIRVFMLARRGLLRPTPATAPPLADPSMVIAMAQTLSLVPALVEQVRTLSADLSTLRAEVSTGVIGEQVSITEIRRPLSQIAALSAAPGRGPKSVRRRFENRLRSLLGHAGPGSRWSMLPRRLLDVAQRQVAMWLDEAIVARAAADRGRQLSLRVA